MLPFDRMGTAKQYRQTALPEYQEEFDKRIMMGKGYSTANCNIKR